MGVDDLNALQRGQRRTERDRTLVLELAGAVGTGRGAQLADHLLSGDLAEIDLGLGLPGEHALVQPTFAWTAEPPATADATSSPSSFLPGIRLTKPLLIVTVTPPASILVLGFAVRLPVISFPTTLPSNSEKTTWPLIGFSAYEMFFALNSNEVSAPPPRLYLTLSWPPIFS